MIQPSSHFVSRYRLSLPFLCSLHQAEAGCFFIFASCFLSQKRWMGEADALPPHSSPGGRNGHVPRHSYRQNGPLTFIPQAHLPGTRAGDRGAARIHTHGGGRGGRSFLRGWGATATYWWWWMEGRRLRVEGRQRRYLRWRA